MWLHDSEIRLTQDDPSGVKRNTKNENADQGSNKRWKEIRTSGKGGTRKKYRTRTTRRKLRGRKYHSVVFVEAISYPVDHKGPSE